MSLLYKKGALEIHGPTAGRPGVAVVMRDDESAVSLVETFDAAEVSSLAVALLKSWGKLAEASRRTAKLADR